MSDEITGQKFEIKPPSLKPLTQFGKYCVSKISNAIGVVWNNPQRQIADARAKAEVRKIEAESDVEQLRIRTEGQIEIHEAYRNALRRLSFTELRNEDNIQAITAKMLDLLPSEGPTSQSPEEDTLFQIFEKCKSISNETMQKAWAKLLANEFASPGSFARKTIDVLGSLDHSDANKFARLASLSWEVNGNTTPLVFSAEAQAVRRHIEHSDFLDLETLGLVTYSIVSESKFTFDDEITNLPIFYQGKRFTVVSTLRAFPLGKVSLTRAGKQLLSLCSQTYLPDYVDYVLHCLDRRALKVVEGGAGGPQVLDETSNS